MYYLRIIIIKRLEMGKAENGIHGQVRGKVGGVVYSSWNGIPVVKAAPVRTAKPTTGEEKQRNLFGEQSWDWINPIREFVKLGFSNYTRTNKGLTAARSYLLKNAVVKDGEQTYFDPAKMLMSYGDLPLPASAQVELTSEDQLVFTWNPVHHQGSSPNDQARMLAYNPDAGDALMALGGKFRKEGSGSLNLGSAKPGTYHVYLAFGSLDGSQLSMSLYLGVVEKE